MKIVYHNSQLRICMSSVDLNHYDKVKEVYVDGEYVGIAFRQSGKKPHCDTRYAWKFCRLYDYDRDAVTLQSGDPGYTVGTLAQLKKFIKSYYSD